MTIMMVGSSSSGASQELNGSSGVFRWKQPRARRVWSGAHDKERECLLFFAFSFLEIDSSLTGQIACCSRCRDARPTLSATGTQLRRCFQETFEAMSPHEWQVFFRTCRHIFRQCRMRTNNSCRKAKYCFEDTRDTRNPWKQVLLSPRAHQDCEM